MKTTALIGYPYLHGNGNEDVLYQKISNMEARISTQDDKSSAINTFQSNIKVQVYNIEHSINRVACCGCYIFILSIVSFGLVVNFYVKK